MYRISINKALITAIIILLFSKMYALFFITLLLLIQLKNRNSEIYYFVDLSLLKIKFKNFYNDIVYYLNKNKDISILYINKYKENIKYELNKSLSNVYNKFLTKLENIISKSIEEYLIKK
ncbi:hypothetical protein PL321_07830 [Caloramator sp. mosi_1]|uniref:hypothetical protein n=1 Tax=Caloramator sp. mosi_1 TaxID=3023090 RepID=UPI00235E6780|nr:hypothetical protein [Caloramator sp. mosi_1]WDC85331.1 hypothetical protein PL321_07830 [Caloramator sp. mosi_1]